MKNYDLITQLIGLVEKAERQTGSKAPLSLEEFTHYLNSIGGPRSKKREVVSLMNSSQPGEYDIVHGDDQEVANELSKLFVLIARFIRTMGKKGLQNSLIQTIEEFSYVAILNKLEDTTKSELINMNFQEKTTGIEVIRRLINLGLVDQFDDSKDKRSKRIRLTNKGKDLLNTTLKSMGSVSELVFFNLSSEERLALVFSLRKIEAYHRLHHTISRGLGIDEIIKTIKR